MTKTIIGISFVCILSFVLFSCGGTNKEEAGSKSKAESLPSLTKLLEDKVANFREKAPPEMVKTVEEGIKEVAASGVMESALKKGDRAPDFELPDATGKIIKLSELLKTGPVVLIWYRGGW